MALIVSTLADGLDGKSGLNGLVTNPIGATKDISFAQASQMAADAWAKAYCDYTIPVMAGVSVPPALPAPNLLSAQFLIAMQAGTFLDMLSDNLVMYWTLMPAPVPFAGVNNGAVTLATAGQPALKAVAATMKLTGNAGGNDMPKLINAIDAFTKLVMTTLLTPTGSPLQVPLL